MTIIEALKERLEEHAVDLLVIMGEDYENERFYRPEELDYVLDFLDSFQQERVWHDPDEKLPEDGEMV